MDKLTIDLIRAGRVMAQLLARDPAGVEMATAIYTEDEALTAIRAWDKLVLDYEPLPAPMYGFDTTVFKADGWPGVCRELGLVFDGRAESKARPGHPCGWTWRNVLTGLIVVTEYNPDTGEHYGTERDRFYDQRRLNWAGYIGVQAPEANVTEVTRAVNAIREHADFIKAEEAGKRGYI